MVNFAVVLAVLYFFVFKPLFKTVAERTGKIEKGLADAELAGKNLKEATDKQAALIAEAKTEAMNIVKQARLDAETKKDEMILKAKEEIGAIIQVEKQKIHQEKVLVMDEIRKEAGEMVALATAKFLAAHVDLAADKKISQDSIKNI